MRTPDDFFGHATHSIPAGTSDCDSEWNRACSTSAEVVKKTIRSSAPAASSGDKTVMPSGSSPSAAANSGGAAAKRMRWPGLIPSFLGSGVPL
ncbi:MAG TPA: hypothetical protein VF092_02735 [Longimicrobium sp.]